MYLFKICRLYDAFGTVTKCVILPDNSDIAKGGRPTFYCETQSLMVKRVIESVIVQPKGMKTHVGGS